MKDENITSVEEHTLRTSLPLETDAAAPMAQDHLSYMTDEAVERAAEKVFRLHTRLFEELAK